MDIKRNKTIQTPDQHVHEYVDLGLPSGTLWATENIKDADGNDLYFAWGDTTGYTAGQVQQGVKRLSWDDYKFGSIDWEDDVNYGMTKYNLTDGLTILEPKDDAATQNWGADWKMPSKTQFEELWEGTDHEYTEIDGIKGLLCISKTNGNTVFFPANNVAEDGEVLGVGEIGVYWSVSLVGVAVYRAWTFDFHNGVYDMRHYGRCYGYSVRPIRAAQTPTHEYVDLGLPSGTLWATENIKNADGNDLYFAWGETTGYTARQVHRDIKEFHWNDYKFGPYNTLTKYNWIDDLKVLEPEDDAATQNWGDEWRMPTNEQFAELLAGTDPEWTNVNGINGLLCTSKINGNTVFLPAVGNAGDGEIVEVGSYGYYWSVSLYGVGVCSTWSFNFNDGRYGRTNFNRCYGFPVRPVRLQNE